MNKQQGSGIIERVLYGMALAMAMKMVAMGWLDETMAPYVAMGVVSAAGGAWAWWINRPQAKVGQVAAMAGTVVADDGQTIHILEPRLIAAAKAEATSSDGR